MVKAKHRPIRKAHGCQQVPELIIEGKVLKQEIERKFLIANDGWRKDVRAVHHIKQAYLAFGSQAHVRVRIVDAKTAMLTIKASEGELSRQEFEYEIPADDAKELLALAEGTIIEKTRHLVKVQGFEWEIDVFEGDNAGLVVAEIELGDRHHKGYVQELPRPEWLGGEITGDRRYYNSWLARKPFGGWRKE
jgi:adenylate cyclase